MKSVDMIAVRLRERPSRLPPWSEEAAEQRAKLLRLAREYGAPRQTFEQDEHEKTAEEMTLYP
jgi:hypothetical protein